jgi:hypothetical protein
MRPHSRIQVRKHCERRHFRRFAIRFPVEVRCGDLRHGADQVDRRSAGVVPLEGCDFSLSGLRVRSDVALPRGRVVTLTWPALGDRPAVMFTGRVARCRHRNDHFDVGIAFCQTVTQPALSPWFRLPELFCLVAAPSNSLGLLLRHPSRRAQPVAAGIGSLAPHRFPPIYAGARL